MVVFHPPHFWYNINTKFTQFISSAAEATIPKTHPHPKNRTIPWWSPEIKAILKERNSTLNRFKRTNDLQHHIRYKQLRAKARCLIRTEKSRSSRSFVASINRPASCSTMWSDIKKLYGSKQRLSIPTLTHNNQTFHSPSEISNILAESSFLSLIHISEPTRPY